METSTRFRTFCRRTMMLNLSILYPFPLARWLMLPGCVRRLDRLVLSKIRSELVIMHDTGLIQNLLAAGVIDKRVNELKFSDAFCKHLVFYNRASGLRGGGTIETWREIMVEFNKSLEMLSDKDVATTIVLLDYFLDKLSTEKS